MIKIENKKQTITKILPPNFQSKINLIFFIILFIGYFCCYLDIFAYEQYINDKGGNTITVNKDTTAENIDLLSAIILNENTSFINNEINIYGNVKSSAISAINTVFINDTTLNENISFINNETNIYGNIYGSIISTVDNDFKNNVIGNKLNIYDGFIENTRLINVDGYRYNELKDNTINIRGGILTATEIYNIFNIDINSIFTDNTINITGGILKQSNIFNIKRSDQENIDMSTNTIFIGGNVNIIDSVIRIMYENDNFGDDEIETDSLLYSNIRSNEYEYYRDYIGINGKIFIASDLSNMSVSLYSGPKEKNNSVYFIGENTKLLDNDKIKDNANVVLANVVRAPKNVDIPLGKTKISIDNNIKYDNGNNILLDGDISLYFQMKAFENSNEPIISTGGKIGILDDLYFSAGKKIAIGLMSSDITELKENESFVLLKGGEGIDENLTASLFGLAKDSDIKNFKITIDKDNGTINLEYSLVPMNVIDEDNNKLLLPDTSGAIYRTTKNNFLHLTNKVNNRLLDLDDNEEMESNWMGIYSGKTKQSSNKDFDTFESKNTGFILGKEFINTKEIKLGGIFNYDFNKMENDYKNIDANSFGLSTYLSYNFSNTNLYFNGVLSYMYTSFKESSNNLSFGNNINDLKFKSKYGSNQIFTNVMFGLRYNNYFEPQIGLNYSYVSVDSYKDNHGNNVDRNNFDALATSVGLVFKNFVDFNYYENIILNPKIFVSYDIGIKKPDLKISGRLNTNDSKYRIKVCTMDENAFRYGINLDLKLFSKVDMTLAYEGVKGKEYKGGEFGLMGSFGW